MAGFSPIETPNFAQAALGGYQAGRAIGKQKREDAGLQLYATDPEAGINALTAAGSPLAEQLRANLDRRQVQEAYSRVFAPPAALGGAATAPSRSPYESAGIPQSAPQALGAPPMMQPADGTSPQLSPEANAMVAPAPEMPPAAPAPTAGGLNVNMEALQQLASLGPEGAKGAQSVYALIQSGNEQRIKAFANHAEMRGQLANYLKTIPFENRQAAYDAALPELQARGFIAQAVQNMRFDDDSLNRDVALAVPTVQALSIARAERQEKAANADRAADNARADRAQAITLRGQDMVDARSRESAARGGSRGSGENAPAGYRFKADGSLEAIPGGPAGAGKPLSEDQGKATGNYRVMRQAMETLNGVKGYNPTLIANALDKGDMTGTSLSQADRRALNAQRAFVVAALRGESGATYGPSEVVDKVRVLFPVPGDGPEVLADKARLRGEFLASTRDRAGPGVANIPRLTAPRKAANRPAVPADVDATIKKYKG